MKCFLNCKYSQTPFSANVLLYPGIKTPNSDTLVTVRKGSHTVQYILLLNTCLNSEVALLSCHPCSRHVSHVTDKLDKDSSPVRYGSDCTDVLSDQLKSFLCQSFPVIYSTLFLSVSYIDVQLSRCPIQHLIVVFLSLVTSTHSRVMNESMNDSKVNQGSDDSISSVPAGVSCDVSFPHRWSRRSLQSTAGGCLPEAAVIFADRNWCYQQSRRHSWSRRQDPRHHKINLAHLLHLAWNLLLTVYF